MDGMQRRDAALRAALRAQSKDLKSLKKTVKRHRVKLKSLKADLAKVAKAQKKVASKAR
jgi:septal ring factor EnvC (AmiA/AmiB activator)